MKKNTIFAKWLTSQIISPPPGSFPPPNTLFWGSSPISLNSPREAIVGYTRRSATANGSP